MDLGAPSSYITLTPGVHVYSSDGQRLGDVEHVLAEPDKDIFDGVVIDTSVLPGGHRFVDAPEVGDIYERGVVLTIDASAAERLPEPSANPATMASTPDDTAEGQLERKLRRAWDLISGNYWASEPRALPLPARGGPGADRGRRPRAPGGWRTS